MLTDNFEPLVEWYVENEPLPAHPVVSYVAKFFAAGFAWNLKAFSSSIIRVLDTRKNAVDNLSFVSGLFAGYISALVAYANDSPSRLSLADERSVLLPLTWPAKEWSSGGGLLLSWNALLSAWAKEDRSVLSRALNPRGESVDDLVDVDDNVVRVVLKAVRAEFDLYSGELLSWMKCWTRSWIKRVDSRKVENSAAILVVSLQLIN